MCDILGKSYQCEGEIFLMLLHPLSSWDRSKFSTTPLTLQTHVKTVRTRASCRAPLRVVHVKDQEVDLKQRVYSSWIPKPVPSLCREASWKPKTHGTKQNCWVYLHLTRMQLLHTLENQRDYLSWRRKHLRVFRVSFMILVYHVLVTMNFMSWNIRGVGKGEKVASIRNLVHKTKYLSWGYWKLNTENL